MIRPFDPIVTPEEITKVYIHCDRAVAFDTTLYHIRGENVGRSKVFYNILRDLTIQIKDGTLTVPTEMEE